MTPDSLVKKHPQPVRFDPADETNLRDIAKETNLPIAEIVRRCVRYAAPKFITGQVSIMNLKRAR